MILIIGWKKMSSRDGSATFRYLNPIPKTIYLFDSFKVSSPAVSQLWLWRNVSLDFHAFCLVVSICVQRDDPKVFLSDDGKIFAKLVKFYAHWSPCEMWSILTFSGLTSDLFRFENKIAIVFKMFTTQL